jgi:hypothetical protein
MKGLAIKSSANLIFVFHFIFGLFLIFGWMYPNLKILHLICLFLWIGSWIILDYCPLTKWEFKLRNILDKTFDHNAEIIQFYIYRFTGHKVESKLIFGLGFVVFIVLLYLNIYE